MKRDEKLRARLGYGGPKLDLWPELFGLAASALLVAAILWSVGCP